MSRICPGGLLSPSPHIKTKNLFPPRWAKCFLLPLTACSLYLSEEKSKAERIDKETKRVVICKQFFPASGLPVHRGASDNFPAKN